jgi:hypothetical protein
MQSFGGLGIANAIEDEVMIPLARVVLHTEHKGQQRVHFCVNALDGQGIVVVEG